MHGGVAQMRVERETECGRQRGGAESVMSPLDGVYGGGRAQRAGTREPSRPRAQLKAMADMLLPVASSGQTVVQRASSGPAGRRWLGLSVAPSDDVQVGLHAELIIAIFGPETIISRISVYFLENGLRHFTAAIDTHPRLSKLPTAGNAGRRHRRPAPANATNRQPRGTIGSSGEEAAAQLRRRQP